MKEGHDTLMPNWALNAMEQLTLAADIRTLIFVTRHRAYRGNTFTTKQIAIALELDIRTAQASTARLAEAGLILSCDGVHCSRDAASRAQAPRKVSAKTLQKDSHQEAEKTAQDSESAPLNKGSNEVRNKGTKKKNPPTPQGEAQESTAPDSGTVTLPEVLYQLTGFPDAWARWLTYRRARRLTLLPMTLTAQLGFLATQPQPIAVINQAIEKGWQGLFPLKVTPGSNLPKPNELDNQDWAAEAREADIRNGFPVAGGWN